MKKRFIAGAKCPKCEAIDRIVMLTPYLQVDFAMVQSRRTGA